MAANQMAAISAKVPSPVKAFAKPRRAEEVGPGSYQAVVNQTLDRIISGEPPGMSQFVRGFHFMD